MAGNFIFVDEAGDPGRPYTTDASGNKIPTGASTFYIITALCLDEKRLFLLEQQMMEIKTSFGYRKEIKSNEISLPLYKALLGLINSLEIPVYFRLIDKSTYAGSFRVDGIPTLHNVFDEYNLARAVAYAIAECSMNDVDIVIDRADRRKLNGKFDAFNEYLSNKVGKYVGDEKASNIRHITHVDSRYVNAMQMSDIVCGSIRDNFTGKNSDLITVIEPKHLIEANRKYEKKIEKINKLEKRQSKQLENI